MSVPFTLLDPGGATQSAAERERRGRLLDQRPIPPALGDHRVAAPRFQPSADLVAAVNVALAVGAPLLLTGEAGTGKTQVAYYLAWAFAIPDERVFTMDVRSTTTAGDLLYTFDSVAYFHAAQQKTATAEIDRGKFVRPGPLWKALQCQRTALLLLDEVDKAPRDFPNDLLGVLERHRFDVPEQGKVIGRSEGAPPPLVVITSNSERRLPEPFLRRCVFHHLELTPELLRDAARARRADFPRIDEPALDAALRRLWELRELGLRKVPGTAELLVWLTALHLQGTVSAATLTALPLHELPCLSALVKDSDDLKLVRGDTA